MTTDYEFLVPTSCICMYKNIRVWRLWAPRWLWARVPCTLCTPYCYATANNTVNGVGYDTNTVVRAEYGHVCSCGFTGRPTRPPFW